MADRIDHAAEARASIEAAHSITVRDETVRGYPGTTATCSCGWKSSWAVRDGSAESDAHQHRMANDPEYRRQQNERYEAWAKTERDKGCLCEHIPGSYAHVTNPACIIHKPRNLSHNPLPLAAHHGHNCSCHISPPCGACENCKHWDRPDCEKDCQTCEEHGDE